MFLEKLASKGMSLAQLPIPLTREGFAQPPLSYAQQRQWFLWQLEPQSAAYNLPAALKFTGELDIAALQRSFEALIARHETLRTTFRLEGEQAVQVIHPHLPFELAVEPMPSANAAAVQARLEAEAQRPFDLEHGPLLRATLLQLGGQEQVLALTLHHIVSDGWSMPVMVDDLVRFYAGFSQQQQVQLPELAIQYADYAIWQRAWMEAGEQDRQLSYWKAQLGDQQPVLELPTDRPRPAVYNQHGARLEIPLAAELVGSLKRLAQQRGVTPFMLLLASFQTLLHRYSGQSDIRVGVPVANRNRVETERLMGFFVNTQVLRAEFDLGTTFMGLLEQVKGRALGAQAHQDLPFEQLVEVLQPERSLSHSPLFQVMYNHQTQAKKPGQQSLPGLAMEELALTSHVAKFDLALDTFEHEAGISAALTFATDLFDLATIERMAQHWLNLLQSIVTQPEQRVADLAMLGQHELQQVIRDWNDTQAEYPAEQCMQQLFEAQVQASPSAPALLFEDQVLSYETLNRRANQLAHKLRDEGVGPDVLVGIAMQRSPEMVIGLLAILKAGGAYVPLDPDYPQDRLEYMLEDSQAIVLLSQSHLLARMPEEFHSRTLLVDQLSLEAYPDSDLSCINQPSNLAYSIYTSGSTGKPKGVLIEHRNVTALIGWALASYSQEDLCGVLASTSICFDLSVWELFVTLSAGGYAVLAANALELPHLAARAQVRLINTVPSAIKMLHETGELPEGVHTINLAGEALKQSLVDDLYATGHVQRVYDLYGPSEDTTYSTFTLRSAHGKANIGRPISNSAVYLLSEAVAPVPVGVVGELYMAGAGLARGYLGRPGLTAERFLPDPFDQQGGGRMYRTGDLARYQNDGLIEYAGRIDHQVKIRGFRIELGEIEARLQAQETVREAVLLAQDGPAGKQLVAYVVPADGAVIATPAGQSALREVLRGQLKQSLPEYMVPSQLLFLEQLPLTPNGKLDRKALPKPDVSQFQAQYVAPRSELERDITAVWANVLKLEQVGITDNFFELGGDSIISLQVVSRARQAGIQFAPKQLFQHQTVQGLASVARRADSVAIDQGAVTGVLPLTPVQHWFFEQSLAQPHHWNQSVLLAAEQAIDPQHLQAALQAVLQQHDALRLGFDQVAGSWQGSFNSVVPQDVLWERAFASLDELQREAAQAQRSFTLNGPLVRALLGTLPDGQQRLLLVVHHLVVDGVSWRVLLEDLQKAYLASAAGQPLHLPAKTSSFQAWSERLQAYGKGEALATELGYWQAQLQAVDDTLPCDRAQGDNLQRHAAYASTSLDREWTHKLLHEAPSAYRTQINDLLLTALARVVARWTGRTEVLVRLEGHGREDVFDDLDLTRTVGWFTSIYPVRLSAHGQLDNAIKTIKEQLRAVPNKGIGYGVLRYLGGDHSRQVLQALPQGEIVFNYLGQFDGMFQEQGNLFKPAKEHGGANHSEDASLGSLLAINGQVYAGELKLGWTFSRERFDTATIERLAEEYAEELKVLISHCCQADQCGVTPSDFPLASLSQAQLDSLPIPTAAIADVYPLAPMQSGMLFHTLYEHSGDDYINQMRVDVEGLDVQRFIHAWQGALDAHAILRTCFVWQGALEQAVQVVLKHVELPFVEHDWRHHPSPEQALQALADSERQRGFEVSSAPLLRLVLVRTGENRHHLMFTHHHILMDGWSTSRLLGEVLQRYAGQGLSNQATHYRDYIAWLQRQPSGAAEHFWKSQLAELQEPTRLALAVRKTGKAIAVGHEIHHQAFDQEQTAKIEAFARANRVTVNTLVQSAWLLLLQRYTGQPTVAFGATVAGRPADLPGVEEQIGLFINTLPVVGSPRAEQTVAQWIAQVQAANLAAREYEHTPLNEVQRWAGLSGEALFDSLLVFENYPVSEALQQGAPAGLRFGEVANHEQTNYPLTVLVNLGATLSLQYNHDQAHWGQPAVCQLAEHFGNLLRALTGDATQPIGDLPLAGQQEQLAILHDWNRSQANFPSEHCIHALIEAQAAASPDALAISFAGQTLSYDALNRRANRLAHRLREAGVGPDVLVGLAVERSLEMVVGLLGILKAGGAYVPLDPESPQDRLAYQFEDSGIALLLTQGHLRDGLPTPPGLRCVALDDQVLAGYSDENPCVAMSPQNLAYVIYTSGSTGKPKGALLTHHNVLRLFAATQDWFQFDASDVWTVFHSYAFDFSVWELYGALLYGGRAVIVPKDVARSAQDFHALLSNEQVTVLNQTPSAFQQLIPIACEAAAAGSQLALRHVVFGGEALDVSSLKPWFDVFGDCKPRMINMYGITETTVHVTYRPINRDDLKNVGSSPIGEVIPDLSWYLLDGSLNPVVPGSQGELMIGQDGLARGYHGRPALTAERFVPNPFDQQGGRLYRSGDLARYAEEGVIEYLGRIDHQVKIRGFRIELGEIEARLQELEPVRQAVVLAQDGPSGKQLVAYVVPADAAVSDSLQAQAPLREALREALRVNLPDYMVPAHMLFLPSLPLTGNGKLDRRALPKPDASLLQGEYVAPQSVLEQQIAGVWADVLKLDKVGLSDNFFELGGDSIISLQVVSRARQLDIQFTPKELFQNQTVQALAAVARRAASTRIEQGPVNGNLPLLPIQQWFFEAQIPQRHHWNQSVLLVPSEPLQPTLLAQALQALVLQHDALRLRFEQGDAGWSGTFSEADSEVLWHREVADAQALQALASEAQRSLNLQQGQLLRAVLAECADGSQRLLVVIHHLVVDGVSWRVLLEDLQQAYQAMRSGQPLKLQAKTTSFKAWAEQLQDYATSAALQAELGYWTAQLQGSSDALPCDRPQGRNLERHVTSVSTRLDRELTRQLLQEAPAAYRTQINDLLLTALARVISRWTGRGEVLVRLEGHGREDLFEGVDLSRTVGWFTSMYPVRLSPQAGLVESLKTIKEQLRAVPNKGLGHGLLRYLGNAEAQATLAALPRGEIVFNYLGQFDASFDQHAGLLLPAKEYAGATQDEDAPLGSLLALNGQVYGGELKLGWSFSRDIFDESTIAQLADDYAQELALLIDHCRQPQHRGVTPSDFPLADLSQTQLDNLPVAVEQIADVYPLSPMQQGMLFHTLYEQQSGDYINQLRVDVHGLDVERFRQAWQAAVDNHAILRSGFIWQGELDQAVQVVHKHVEQALAEHDWRGQPALEQALQDLADGDRQAGFALDQVPLQRLTLVRTADDSHHLIYTNHHILMDGWSTSRLLGEVLQRYAGQPVMASAAPYRDYIAWLQRQDAAATEAFWKGQLAPLEEPTRLAQVLRSNAAPQPGQGEHFQVFDRATTQRIDSFARANRVTVNTLVQSAWLLLLQRYTGQPAVCFGATVAGRPADLPGVEEQIGLFINTLPVVGAPRSEQTVAEWIAQVQDCNLALREFEHTPLNEVQRWAGLGGEALFDSLLVFENYPVSQALQEGAPDGLRFGQVASLEQTNYPLTLAATLGDTLAIQYSHNRANWNDAAIQRVAEHFGHLLQALIVDASAALGELSLLGDAERQLLLEDWNRSEAITPSGKCAHQLFQAQAGERPDATALVFGEQQLTYRELDLRTNRLAHLLVSRGVTANSLVGVAAERGLALAVALIAIHKAGAAYVPLDPEYPQDRLAYLIEDSGIGLLLGDAQSMARMPLPNGLPCIDLQQDEQWLQGFSDQPLPCTVTLDSLAYVIYTSGSTGMPKGVAIAHQALSVFCEVASGYSRLTPQDRVLQFATFSFDGFIEQFFPPLSRGACVVMRDQHLWDTDTFSAQVIHHGITVADLPAAYWRLLALDRRPAHAYGQLKQIHVGGEAVALDGLQAWLEDGPAQVRLLNTYGPTEATVVATTYDCSRLAQVPAAQSGVPIGRALAGRIMRALDDGLSPTPIGVPGELYIGGEGCLARCYHQRPALTAERFIPDPLAETPGARLYRTGDLGYFDEQGELAYRGRADHQVKVRGFRIELGEIEQHLQAHPHVRQAAVIAVDHAGVKQLCGYVVPEDEAVDQEGLPAALKQALKDSLPDYMVPTYLMLLEHMPLTPSGKLDRKRLPSIDQAQAQSEYVAPRNALERQLAEIWAGVLKVAQVGVTDNFFELGGDSIISIQLVSRARQAGILFTPKQLFQHQTVEQLAAVAEVGEHVASDQVASTQPAPLAGLTEAQLARLPVPREQIDDVYPLSPMQQGMLFYSAQGGDAALYLNQTSVTVDGLDIQRFAEAWKQVVARHDILRTGFCSDAQLAQPLQIVHRHVELPIHVLDWRHRDDQAEALQALIDADAEQAFDMAQPPLMRVTLVRLDDLRMQLIWTRHHILMDGWSNSRLLGEVFQAYHGQALDTRVPRFGDYIRWLQAQPQAELEAFWTQKLAALESPTLLEQALSPRPDANLSGHAALYLHWDAQRTQRLRNLAQRLRVTPNTLVQAAWLLLLQRYSGQQTVCFGATVAGRPANLPGVDNMLGLFINTLPVVQAPAAHWRVSDWLQQLQDYNLELRDHEHAALSNVQRWAGRPGQPLFDSIIVFENYPLDDRLHDGGGDALQFGAVAERGVTNYAMDLAVLLNDTFSVEFMYLRNCFSEAATAVIRGSFERLLEGMLDNPQATLGSLDMLTPEQVQQACQRNHLVADTADAPRLAQHIAEHARLRPDAVAVVCGDEQLSYAQLDLRANRLAHHLIALGTKPETTVGIALERSVEVIVAFLAVMKTGAAYVPLDIEYPQERLQWIVEDSAMHLLLTSSTLRQRFDAVGHIVELDRLELAGLSASMPQAEVLDDNLAYLIYTSGSTGKPKGVAVSHGQIRMHCQAIAQLYEMDERTRELLFMSFAFDGAQERWLSTLSSGGCLVIRGNRLWTAEETWQVLHEQRIDIACFPPAYLQQLAEFGESQQQAAPPVRIYCFGGDAVPDALFELVKRTLRPQYLTNGYGPTETVVTPLLWKVAADQSCQAVYAPIGDRVGQRTLQVLDQDLNPLPDGVAGELYIGGEGVARGYHQRAALTAERFVADPFAEGARLYRTGDRVRRRADGTLDFIGRLDNQLKIRGFRIEPGEIEARLRNLADIRDAVVVARDTATGKQLVGYVVSSSVANTPAQLREALRAELPDYMVPTQLVLLDAMPLTPNGKIDRNALPAPDFIAQRQRVAPRNEAEQALAQIWQEVLSVEEVGIEDNFFELGGDSLRVLKMLSKVRAHSGLQLDLKLRDVMAKPTIAELSGYSEAEVSLDPVLLLNTRIANATPLFCLHAGFGTVFDYEPLARRLEGVCSVYGVQCRMLLDRAWQDESLQAMAIDYAQYIRQKQPEGPYRLAGWSLGGTLAVLVAQELERQGQAVTLLGLVDSFVPCALHDEMTEDWTDDLQGFLSVLLGVPKHQLVVPAIAVGTDVTVLQEIVEQVRADQAGQSLYADIDSAELAHTFDVAMRLKALSLKLTSLPRTKALATCWWAGRAADPAWTFATHASHAVEAGHYDILKHTEVIEGLAMHWLAEDTMIE
ncbi:non-ribosomal peptide synthase/polyketide synthase [Pseudomonas sp. NY11955]|uniref:non-ribosomal peptide synthase/polyketide synthase n=1 Tax=Pseudomonas sp. NY11955 TaxID=3400363 RepID=UPI003A8A9E4D